MITKTIKQNKDIVNRTEKTVAANTFEGQSIEEKVRKITETGQAIEAISPMIYQERKEGVKPDYDIRTDKWEIAQEAMTSIAEGRRTKRQEKQQQQQQQQQQQTE